MTIWSRKFEGDFAGWMGWKSLGSCFLALRFLGVVGLFCGLHVRAGADEASVFRVGFSSSMFSDINENDAKASVRGWAQTVAQQRNIPTAPDTLILRGVPEMLDALRGRRVDAVGLGITEYAALRDQVRFAPVFATYVAGRIEDNYILLVHQDGGVQGLGDLSGRTIQFHQNIRSCLAQAWLDTLLVQRGFKPVAEMAERLVLSPKLSRTVLPVFFRQSAACVVPRSGFETMAELNPQLGRQLKVLATSPAVVPAVFCFRADYAPPFKDDLLAGMRELHLTPAGQQVLTVFQSEKIEEQPASCLDATVDLIRLHARLTRGTNPVGAASTPAPKTPP